MIDHGIFPPDVTGDDWEVWTPAEYGCGAIIGSGPTEQAAKADAVKNMEHLIDVLIGAKKP